MPKPNWVKEHEQETATASAPKPKPKAKAKRKAKPKPKLKITDLKPTEMIAISSKLLRTVAAETFCIEAHGHGMEPDISSGDYLMCTPMRKYRNGQIVVLFDGVEAHCKYYIQNGDEVIFQNGKKEIFDAEGFEIAGRVMSKYGHMFNKK